MVSASNSAIHGLHEDFLILVPQMVFGVIYFSGLIAERYSAGLQ